MPSRAGKPGCVLAPIAPTTAAQTSKDACTSSKFLRVCPQLVGPREGCCGRFPFPCEARPGSDQCFPAWSNSNRHSGHGSTPDGGFKIALKRRMGVCCAAIE
jgi:hypothetical protein